MKDRPRGGALSFFRDLRIGRKLSAAMAVGVLALVVLSLVGANALQAAGRDSDSLLAADKAGRAAMMADMMHDGVHADVLQSLLFRGAQYESTLKELAEHSRTLKEALAR